MPHAPLRPFSAVRVAGSLSLVFGLGLLKATRPIIQKRPTPLALLRRRIVHHALVARLMFAGQWVAGIIRHSLSAAQTVVALVAHRRAEALVDFPRWRWHLLVALGWKNDLVASQPLEKQRHRNGDDRHDDQREDDDAVSAARGAAGRNRVSVSEIMRQYPVELA